MKKRKLAMLMAAVLAAGTCLGGCGTSDANTTTAAPTTAAASAGAGATQATGGETQGGAAKTVTMPVSGVTVDAALFDKPVEINTMTMRSAGSEAIVSLMEGLNEIENITFTNTFLQSDDIISKCKLALASNSPSPYQYIAPTTSNIYGYIDNGWLMPLDEYIEKYREEYHFDDIPQSLWDLCTVDGHIYGIPTVSNNQHLFYRTDIFEELNLEVPQTIEELLTCCEAIRASGKMEYPLALVYGQPSSIMTEFINMMNAGGGEWFDEKYNVLFNDERGVAAVNWMAKLYDYMNPSCLTYTNDDVMIQMQTGQAAIANIWTTRAASMDDKEVSSVVGLIGYAPAPVIEVGGVPMSNQAADFLSIPANVAEDPEVIFLCMAEQTSRESQTETLRTKNVPARQYVVDSNPDLVAAAPNIKACFDTAALGALPTPDYTFWSDIWSLVGTYVAQSLAGEMEPQAALDQAASEVEILLVDLGLRSE